MSGPRTAGETGLLTFLRLALSDHEGADLGVGKLQQLLGLVSAQPLEQPAGSRKTAMSARAHPPHRAQAGSDGKIEGQLT